MSSINFWLEAVIDAYLQACARGEDWRAACAAAEANATKPWRVLTQKDLKHKKGLSYSRQHITRRVNDGTFPRPFQLPESTS